MNAFIAAVRAIVWKDLASEWRSREQMASMFFFALLTLFIFNFSLNLDPAQVRELMPGLIWIAFSFTAVIGLGRSFIAERENDCLDALLMSPAPKGALYLGKLIANLLFTLAVEVVLFPLFVLFFNFDPGPDWPMLLPVFALGTLGLAALGTLFSAMMVQVRARELMFPILTLPLAFPVIIGAVQATAAVLAAKPLAHYSGWLQLLTAFDLVFVIVAYWTFEFVLES